MTVKERTQQSEEKGFACKLCSFCDPFIGGMTDGSGWCQLWDSFIEDVENQHCEPGHMNLLYGGESE